MISRLKLIDLIQSGKKTETVKLKNPLLCMLVFLIAAVLLGYAYYQVGWNFAGLSGQGALVLYIVMGAVGTVLVFWSVSGMLTRLFLSMKGLYYRGLNAFTFRQVASKINTTVLSMSVICLMLFVTICALCASFSMRNAMKANLETQCPADMQLNLYGDQAMEAEELDVSKVCLEADMNMEEYLQDEVQFFTYHVYEIYDQIGEQMGEEKSGINPFVVKLSDYNALMALYGRPSISLAEDEYALVSDFSGTKAVLNEYLARGMTFHLFGHTLHSATTECVNGFIDISAQHINNGFLVVPDAVPQGALPSKYTLIGNYRADSREEKQAIEEQLRGDVQNKLGRYLADRSSTIAYGLSTRLDIAQASVGLGALVTFLGLYIGITFLIACGAVLALKGLSESVDSARRYDMLRKLGAEEGALSRSLLWQTGIFFLLPLLLACFHSIFGMKFAVNVLEIFGTEGMGRSIFTTALILLCIYGGYFLVTYFSSRAMVRERRNEGAM